MIAATMLLKQPSSNFSFFHTRKKYPAFNFVRVYTVQGFTLSIAELSASF